MKPLFATAHRTNLNQVLQGICIGAVAGAAIFPVGPLVLAGAGALLTTPPSLSTLAGGLAVALIAAIIASCVWAFCIGCFAGPVWWVLHSLGLRNWPWAVAVGAASLAGFLGLSDMQEADVPTFAGIVLGFNGALLALAAAVGGGLGFLIWRVAYRPIGDDAR